MRGRRPKPRALKLLLGNPGKRALGDEMQGEPGLGPCPDHLTGHARDCWLDLAPQLDALGIAQRQDRGMFEGLCVAYGTWRTALELIARDGMTYTTTNPKTGAVTERVRPEVGVARGAERLFAQFATEFGLSPSSRQRVAFRAPRKATPLRNLIRSKYETD
ncbi:MAG: phage terminase small subunit P27 family [Deltaproteobacteria bacterium]|nr:phage terminase small subunit P27 family [Deltaproteobacteria bacterium]